MSVAESTEILRPMTQLGCAQAASGVTAASASAGVSRKGPPEAVSSTRVIPGGATPVIAPGGRHWKIALCSLSIGSSVAPEAFTASIRSGPAITSDSLLASSSRLPARAAASVERSPAAPTMAAMTQCTSGSSASSSSAPLPASTRVPSAAPSRCARSSAAARSSASAAYAGRQVRICCASFAALLLAAMAMRRKRCGWRARTSSVLSPTEPVEPRTATPIML